MPPVISSSPIASRDRAEASRAERCEPNHLRRPSRADTAQTSFPVAPDEQTDSAADAELARLKKLFD
jgi:hypothetical protein